MTISYVNKGTIGDATGNASPTSVATPASMVNGNLLALLVQSGSTTNLITSTPSGWTLVGDILGGDASAYSTTAGPRHVAAFVREVDGSEGASVSVTWDSAGGGGAEFQGQIHQFSRTAGAWAAAAFVTGQDTSVGNGTGAADVTSSSSLTVAAGDVLLTVTGFGNDSLAANPALTMSGVTLASVTEREAFTQSAGRGGIQIVTADVSTSGTAAVRLVSDILTDPAGAATVFLRLRESAGSDTALASAATAQTTATAAVSTAIRAVAAASTVSTLTAAATTQIRLAASVSSQATVTASLSTQVRLAAAFAGVCTGTAALSTQVRLTGSMSTTSTATAGLSAAIRFAAALLAQATSVATLAPDYRNYALLGNFDPWRLKARAAGSDAASSDVAAAAVVNTTVSASLTTGVRFTAAVAVSVTVTPSLSTGIRPAAGVQVVATGSAQLTTGIRPIAGVQVAVSVTAILTGTSAPMEINAQGQVSVTASLTTAVRLAAVAIAQAQASAQFTTGLTMVAVAQTRVNMTGTLGNQPVFTADGSTRIGRRRAAVTMQRIG